jgi:hypothetical protein
MTTYSWMYGRGTPLKPSPLQVMATPFASSSLSSQADHDFALDYGKGVPHLSPEVKGTAMNGATFNNEDRSALGVSVERLRKSVKFTGYPEMSTPNVDSLSRSNTQLGRAPPEKQFDSVK